MNLTKYESILNMFVNKLYMYYIMPASIIDIPSYPFPINTKNKRMNGVNQKLSPGLSKNVVFNVRQFQGSKNRAVNTKM